MIRYTICHNDDDPKDPAHRRVEIGVIDAADGGYIVVADGDPVDLAPPCATEDEADAVIRQLWDSPYWDLRTAS